MEYKVNLVACRVCGGTLNDASPKVVDAPQVGGGQVGIGMIHRSCAELEAAHRA